MKHDGLRFSWICATFASAVLLATSAVGGGLQVSDVTVTPRDEKTAFLKFSVSWKESWRFESNHDAVWVFFKAMAEGEKQWQPVRLAANRVLNPDGYEQSQEGTPLDFIVPDGPDGFMGVFLRRADYCRISDVQTNELKVIWDCRAFKGPAQTAKVKGYGIEMVYVAEGPFYVGTGGAEANAFCKFTDGIRNGQPYLVSNAGPIPTGRKNGCLWAGGATPEDGGEIPAAFPNGYRAFYCMRYPILQWDYADFLNALPPAEAEKRYHSSMALRSGDATNYVYRPHTPRPIVKFKRADAISYQTFLVGPAPAMCHGLSWGDGAAFAAWAGLRPLTEMELEKVVRGPREPVLDEVMYSYWWVQCGSQGKTGGNFGSEQSERAVSVGHAVGRKFAGTHGRGTPDLPKDWPQEDAVGAGMRISSWGFSNRVSDSESAPAAERPAEPGDEGVGQYARRRVSDRQNASLTDPERRPQHLWRGCRTAPAEAAEPAEAVELQPVAGKP
jgi:hypothetical protein